LLNGASGHDAISVINAGFSALYQDVVIHNNRLQSQNDPAVMDSFIWINNTSSDNQGSTWNNLHITNNTIRPTNEARTDKGIYIGVSSAHSGVFNQLLIEGNIIQDDGFNTYDLTRGIEFYIDSANVTLNQPSILSNDISLRDDDSIAILMEFDDNVNTLAGGAQVIDLTISGNNDLDATEVVVIDGQGSPRVQNLRIDHNDIGSSNATIGVHIFGRGQSIWDGLSISNNNRVEAYGQVGIWIQAQSTSQWYDVEINNNSDVIGTTDSSTNTSRTGIEIDTLDEPVFHSIEILNNNRISGSSHAIEFDNNLGEGATFKEVRIESNNVISGNGEGRAIDISSNNDSVFESLSIKNNGSIAADTNSITIELTSGGSVVFEIENNSGIAAGDNGIRLISSASSTWSGLIQNNQLSGNGTNGIHVDWGSATQKDNLYINNNRIAYQIGLLADSYDIQTLANVTNNQFTSNSWYIKDVTPDLGEYIEIRSGVLVANNNSYDEVAYISFLNDRNPNGIRPESRFNMWNESRFFGFLSTITTNDNAQFNIGVNGPLAQENNVIRLDNYIAPGNLSYRYYTVASGSTPYGGRVSPQSASDFNAIGGVGFTLVHQGSVDAIPQIVNDSSRVNVDNILNFGFGDLRHVLGKSSPFQDDNYALLIEGFFVPQETGTYTFTVNSDDAVDLFVNGVQVAFDYGQQTLMDNPLGTHSGTISLVKGQSYSFRVRHQEVNGFEGLQVFWRRPSQISDTLWYQYDNELAPLGFNNNTAFDLSNIEITTSGLRLYSNGNGVLPAVIRNIPQAGVTSSGVILNLNAPGIQLDNLVFEHGHSFNTDYDDDFLDNPTGVIEVRQSNIVLSGLSFYAATFQDLPSILITNDSSSVESINLHHIEVGSGLANNSYFIG
jgi:hypothetical protein